MHAFFVLNKKPEDMLGSFALFFAAIFISGVSGVHALPFPRMMGILNYLFLNTPWLAFGTTIQNQFDAVC